MPNLKNWYEAVIDFKKVILVRERKVKSARAEEMQLSASCDNSRAMVAEAKQNVATYSESIKGLEVQLLSDLMKKNITVQDVAKIRDKLKEAQEHAQELVDTVHQKQAELLLQEQLLENQQQKSVHLDSKLNRITQLNNKLVEAEATNRLKEEDAKMDEFAETMSARGRL